MVLERLLGDRVMLEYEKKILLTEEEYTAIVNVMCKGVLPERQVNYYFDTDNLSMNKKGITCRIREKSGLFETTIKKHNLRHPECSAEDNLVVTTTLNTKPLEEMGLSFQGMLITDRIVICIDAICDLVIDRNTYLGYTDYELEVEYRESSRGYAQVVLENIANLLVREKIKVAKEEVLGRVGQGKNKSQRFFERKMKEEVSNAIGIK